MEAITKMRTQQAAQLLHDRGFAPVAVPWLRNWLVQFDLAKLSSIDLRQTGPSQHGACWGSAHPPPKRSRKIGWQLYCAVSRDLPGVVATPLPPLYRAEDGSWGATPSQVERYGDRMPVWDSEILDAYQLCLTVSKEAAGVWAEENELDGARIVGMGKVKGRPMVKIDRLIPIANGDEAAVWILTNLCYYWLRHTQQIPGMRGSKDAAAGLFACETLETFQKERAGA
jgi:hypothetical protein